MTLTCVGMSLVVVTGWSRSRVRANLATVSLKDRLVRCACLCRTVVTVVLWVPVLLLDRLSVRSVVTMLPKCLAVVWTDSDRRNRLISLGSFMLTRLIREPMIMALATAGVCSLA